MIILTKCDKPHYNQLLTSAYIWVHIIATCCVYNDLAPSLLTGNKHEFEYQILINYLVAKAVPLQEYHVSFLFSGMAVMVGSYL